MTQSVKSLPHKHEDLSLIPNTHKKEKKLINTKQNKNKQTKPTSLACNMSVKETEIEGSLNLLASQA